MDSVKDKVYAVTGLAGMGLSVATLLHSHGARLSLADKDPTALSTAVARINPADPATVLTTEVDITSSLAVNSWIEATVAHFGRLDGAANMAGAIGAKHGVGKLIDQDDEEWDMLLRVNMTGLFYCLRAQLRSIFATAEGKGSIVNAASIQGLRGFACHAAYSATKHGVIGLTRSVAKEVGEGIRVNVVAP
jgi:NAD(P)-dependent dehydrogenase (short-subunit alcohol dehydrogenase family)